MNGIVSVRLPIIFLTATIVIVAVKEQADRLARSLNYTVQNKIRHTRLAAWSVHSRDTTPYKSYICYFLCWR
jgi:hypothetical protein